METFLKHRRIIPYQEFQNLERRIMGKRPIKALTDPNFMDTAVLKAVCGIPYEELRDRQHLFQMGQPDYSSYVCESGDSSDRRRFDRIPLRDVQVTFVTADERYDDVEPADVSYGGVALIMEREKDVHLGQKAGVSIRFGEGSELLLPGEVVNIIPHDVKQRIGLRFNVEHAAASVEGLQQLMMHCLSGVDSNEGNSETKAA